MGRSSRLVDAPVKARPDVSRDVRGIGRHFEGWQPGLIALFLAATSAVLAVPRPATPDQLPEPWIAPRALADTARSDQHLADEAERERLDIDVRALGTALRAYGLADAGDDGAAVVSARRDVASAAQAAMGHGSAALLKLRAFQLRAFLHEVDRWGSTGNESQELREVGGPFIRRAQASGWTTARGLLMNQATRATLFKKRWNELTMVHGGPFEPTLHEKRSLYRFLLRHPPADDAPARHAPDRHAADLRLALAAEQYRLRKIEEIRAFDPDYPADLARGVVLYRLHRYPLAVEAFRRHLEDHPEGFFTVRAQNYLRAALGQARDTG